ncbi:hypothetical protein [Streptomyces sp. NPDC002671]
MTTGALCPSFDAGAIRTVLDDYGLDFQDLDDDLPTAVARHLALGRTVGWFQGRMEAGPARSAAAASSPTPTTPVLATTSTTASSTGSRGGPSPRSS